MEVSLAEERLAARTLTPALLPTVGRAAEAARTARLCGGPVLEVLPQFSDLALAAVAGTHLLAALQSLAVQRAEGAATVLTAARSSRLAATKEPAQLTGGRHDST